MAKLKRLKWFISKGKDTIDNQFCIKPEYLNAGIPRHFFGCNFRTNYVKNF
jgi:hypothetical protein